MADSEEVKFPEAVNVATEPQSVESFYTIIERDTETCQIVKEIFCKSVTVIDENGTISSPDVIVLETKTYEVVAPVSVVEEDNGNVNYGTSVQPDPAFSEPS